MSCAFGSGYTLNPIPRLLSDIRVTLTQKHTHMESQTETSKHIQKHMETDRLILTHKPTLIEDNTPTQGQKETETPKQTHNLRKHAL